MLHKLVFDTTDANTMADSHSVGAYLRAGADGALIDHQTINSMEWLNTAAALFASDGVGITQTAGALDVNLKSPITVDTQLEGIYDGGTNPNPDNTGVIFHTRAASPADAQQVERTTAGAASSDAVVAANVHGADANSFNMIFNGTTWDRVRGTSGSMNVNITTATVTVSDAALANTAYAAGKTTLTTAGTAQSSVASPLANRKYLWLYNKSNREAYIGADSNGYPLPPGSEIQMRAGAAVDVQVTPGVNSSDLRYLQLS